MSGAAPRGEGPEATPGQELSEAPPAPLQPKTVPDSPEPAAGFEPSPALRHLSPLERLETEPARFEFDQAVMVTGLAAGGPASDPLDLDFRTAARLAHPSGAVLRAEPRRGELTLGGFGLIGAGGALPRHHTALTAAEQRKRSAPAGQSGRAVALHAFLDLLARRMAALHAKAGAKYRPTRDPEAAGQVLAAAIGMATPGLDGRLSLSLPALLYHSGNLAARNRSAERLRAMLEAETGRRVEIEEFAGEWMRLPEGEQTRLPHGRDAPQHCALGQGAVVGAQVWDAQARFIIRIGPLTRLEFEALLPGMPAHRKISQLTRLFVGQDTSFAVNLLLRAEEVPAAALGGGARLGWSSWTGAGAPRRDDASDPLFSPRDAA